MAFDPEENQILAVESKRMLAMLMEAFGSKKLPQFTETDCGPQGVMVTVTIDVSCAKYHFGEKTYSAVIEGEPNTSKVLAEQSAVLKAIKYLNDRHKVKVLDFSSRNVYRIEGTNAFGHVNSALYSLDKLIGQWEITMGQCKELAIKLDAKDANNDGVGHGYERWDMYGSLKDFMAGIVNVYNQRVSEARAKASALEFLRKKYHQRSTEKYQENLGKAAMQHVYIPQKMILDYVLECLGSGKAEYVNGPRPYGMKGEAFFYLEPVEGADSSGNMKIKGKGIDSSSAEEDAAFKSLLFIEERNKIRVHDICHAERLNAERDHRLMIRLLEQILDEFASIKKNWAKMVKYISKERRGYMSDPALVFQGDGALKKAEAYSFCAEQKEKLNKNSTERFEECGGIFEELRKMGCKLQELKTQIDLD